MKKTAGFFLLLCCFAAVCTLSAAPQRVINTAAGGRVRTIDPAFADDFASRNLIGAVYDTLLEYDYDARPYKLKPAMLKSMPRASKDFRRYSFELRDDLYFASDPVFGGKREKITSSDVLYSFLRIADARNHSPLYWLFRRRIAGIDDFHARSAKLAKGDMRIYDRGISGFVIRSDREFDIILNAPDPRFLYALAMPNCGIVAKEAVIHYGESCARHPVGSGPFVLKEWIPNLRLRFRRNPDYRSEYFTGAVTRADRQKKLPLLDGVDIFQIRQPMTAWMMFLQGRLDCNALDKDNCETLAGGGELLPALSGRGIVLDKIPEFEIRYV